MVVLNVTVNNCTPQTIVIGRRGTYDTMQIAFDLSFLIKNYGSGTAVLAIKRSQDESAYPVIVTQEDATLLWIVNETDTAYVGSGECQLMWYVDGGLAKTIIYPMVVMRDILQTAEQPPDGYEKWVDHLTELGAETQQNAQNAAQSASDAENAKDDAVAAKEAAEEAQEKAETAVTHYPKIENNYWMVWDVDSQSYVSTGIQAEGEDGYSPEISITTITGGHRVTITDKDHPQGQSFDVLDGQGGGGTSDYTDLTNKPQINGHTLTGNQTAEQLDLATPSDIPTDAGDIEYDESATYQAGSVGAELQEQNRQISDVEENKIPELKNAISQLQPTATASDVGKAIVVKTVDTQTGKPTSYEYGEVGGGNEQLIYSYTVADNYERYVPLEIDRENNRIKLDHVDGLPSSFDSWAADAVHLLPDQFSNSFKVNQLPVDGDSVFNYSIRVVDGNWVELATDTSNLYTIPDTCTIGGWSIWYRRYNNSSVITGSYSQLEEGHKYRVYACLPIAGDSGGIQTTGNWISKADYEFFGLRSSFKGVIFYCCINATLIKQGNYILMTGRISGLDQASTSASASYRATNANLSSYYFAEQFSSFFLKFDNYGILHNGSCLRIYDAGVV